MVEAPKALVAISASSAFENILQHNEKAEEKVEEQKQEPSAMD